jgi:hypothetical protein
MLSNLGSVGMAAEDCPRLRGRSVRRAFPIRSAWCVKATTPYVPFCAAVREAPPVVLSRRSGRGGVRVIAEYLHAPRRCLPRFTSFSASDLCAGGADSGWQRSRELQRLRRHMGSAFKCCQPIEAVPE